MEKYQVIQIGANIISQYSSDNYPTSIQLGTSDTAGLPLVFSGIKNLPYFNTVSERTFRPPAGSTVTPNTNQGYIHAWVVFSLWNPHMNAGTASGSGPTSLRVLVRSGTLIPKVAFGGVNSSNSHANLSVQGRDFSASPCWIQFSLSDYSSGFADPIELTTANSPHAVLSDVFNHIPTASDATTDYNDLALYVGWNQSLDEMLAPNDVALGIAAPPGQTFDGTSISLLPTTTITPTSSTVYKPFSMELQYADAIGNWHTYQVMPGIVLNGAQHGSPFLEPKDPLWTNYPLITNNEGAWGLPTNNPWQGTIPVPRGAADLEFGYLDPRTTRIPPCEAANPPLSTNGTSPGLSDYSPPIATRFYAFATKGSFNNLLPENAYGQHFVVGYWDWWDDNLPVSTSTGVFSPSGNSYNDRDYVRRLGDSAGYAWSSTFLTNVVAWSGLDPLMPLPPYEPGTGGQAYRSIMLSRPFHSVGELGYAFRDLPWKTLDFFSNKSADAPLLDLFCLGPGASATPEAATPSVVAGTVNINSAPVEVLTALLVGTGKTLDPANSDNFLATLSLADAQTIAKTYITYIQSNPLVSPADLPRVLPQVALYTGANTPTKATANSAFPGLKTSREMPIRALAGATSTRTWNVLIDVVAQSGRFLPTATTLDQFSDKGERRYWFHVAIDRFTGKVIDQKVEFVPQ